MQGRQIVNKLFFQNTGNLKRCHSEGVSPKNLAAKQHFDEDKILRYAQDDNPLSFMLNHTSPLPVTGNVLSS